MPTTTFYNLEYSTQQSLLRGALSLFAKTRYDDLSVRAISREMGITTGAFYRYFGSKEEFYIYMVDYTLEQFWFAQKRAEAELGHPVHMQEVLAREPIQAGFWKLFYQASLDIRMKYYFRTKGNPLFDRKRKDVQALLNVEDYTQEERDIAAFLITVLQYVVTSYKYLEHRDFDDEDMFQVFNHMILRGFQAGKGKTEKTDYQDPTVYGELDS